VDIAPREVPSDELQAAIASAQVSLTQACEAAGTAQDPIRLILAGLSDTIGIFGKSIRRWERAVADVVAARELSDDDRSALTEATEKGAYNGMRKEAQRMIRTLDRRLMVSVGLGVGGAFVLGAVSAIAVLMLIHAGPFSPQEAWRDVTQNNPDPRPAFAAADIRTDRSGRRYYAGLSLWLDPARPPSAQ
jgi:hypothetical protein